MRAAAVDALLWDRSLRTKGAALRKDVAIQNARASAAIDGIDIALSAWVTGDAFDDSPIGHAAAGCGALSSHCRNRSTSGPWRRCSRSLGCIRWLRAMLWPMLTGLVGRAIPKRWTTRCGSSRCPTLRSMKVRLAGLAQVTTTPTEAPAIVQAAVVHGELVALRPFEWEVRWLRGRQRESCWRNVGSIQICCYSQTPPSTRLGARPTSMRYAPT